MKLWQGALIIAIVFFIIIGLIAKLSSLIYYDLLEMDADLAPIKYHQDSRVYYHDDEIDLSAMNDGYFRDGVVGDPFMETDEGHQVIIYLLERASRFWGNNKRVFDWDLMDDSEMRKVDRDTYDYFYTGQKYGWHTFNTSIYRYFQIHSGDVSYLSERELLPPNRTNAQIIMEFYLIWAYLAEDSEYELSQHIYTYGEWRDKIMADKEAFIVMDEQLREIEIEALQSRCSVQSAIFNRGLLGLIFNP